MRTSILPFAIALLAFSCSGDDDGDEPARPACKYHSDCGTGVCFQLECHPTGTCFDRGNCRTIPVCADEQCICDTDANRCLPVCETDNDCSAEAHCLDGRCEAHPAAEFIATPGPGGSARGALQVGLGIAPLDFPVGVSLAGYGSRFGPRTPYRDSLGGSSAWFDRPDVRALVFDDGKELFVLLRLPTCWTTDFMVARTAEKVMEATGVNLIDHILTSSPHSHSQPARYWHLVKGLGFGFFGYGEWSPEIFERLTSSFAEAIIMAMDAREPAKFGYAVLDDFDPTNDINRDRRERNNGLPNDDGKDNRMVVMRVDDANDQPIAVLSNFGIHGTVFGSSNPVVTADAGGGVEGVLTDRASEKYGRDVTGFFIQGNAGDISPDGDDLGHPDFERIQLIGERAWGVIEPALDGITTSADTKVGFATQRVPITHELLGYGPGKFFDANVSCENGRDYFRFGAFQCVEGLIDDEDPSTAFEDGALNCVFGVECLTDGHPVPQFQKTVLSVARLGTLALASMPGEPLSQFGRDHSDRIESAVEGIEDATILGYSQDHHFYLLNEDDWLQGGYEPSRDIWGWKFGPYLQDNSLAIAEQLAAEPEDRTLDNQNLKPMYWVDPPEETAWVELTPTSGDPAAFSIDAPAQHERLDELVVEWAGGHPGVDQPVVILERDDGQGFAPVRKPGDRVYDDRGFEMIVEYRGACTRAQCEDHKWAVRWQERGDFPLGTYRLAISGRAFVSGSVVDYTMNTAAFEVVASTRMQLWNLAFDGEALTGFAAETPLVRLEPDGDTFTAEDNTFLLRSTEAPAQYGAPLADGSMVTIAGTVRAPGGATTSIDTSVATTRLTTARRRITGVDAEGVVQWANGREYPTSRWSVSDAAFTETGDYFVSLTMTDTRGNLGTVTATVTR
ncbi:MAG: neutral/alkaline non-lysosomal ceramidase N-terminal domain-containing protein [Deltaproteobacteria bacterium]|jgi:neutral ceramidase